MKWLDSIPLSLLVLLAVWMAISPLQPEPHIVEKWRWLLQGTLSRPLDFFDLVLHTAPLVVLSLKLWRRFR